MRPIGKTAARVSAAIRSGSIRTSCVGRSYCIAVKAFRAASESVLSCRQVWPPRMGLAFGAAQTLAASLTSIFRRPRAGYDPAMLDRGSAMVEIGVPVGGLILNAVSSHLAEPKITMQQRTRPAPPPASVEALRAA